MTDPGPLIVPIDVAAMVVTTGGQTFLRNHMDYGQLEECESPSPAPFVPDSADFGADRSQRGVYLLWTLPAGLRRQQAEAHGTGIGSFPLVPNRWLVSRTVVPTSDPAAEPLVTSWVVQSDALGSSGGSAYLDPFSDAATPIRIGARTQITKAAPWQEPAAPGEAFLTAVAEGNPAFAAFQPFNTDVLSIFDDLDTQNIAEGTVSYSVIGWYADPSTDPLATATDGATFQAALGQLGWSVDTPDDRSTNRSLYQGSAHAVPWTSGSAMEAPYRAALASQVAIGATSLDAVAAFAHAAFVHSGVGDTTNLTPDQATDLLTAFAYDLLPLLGTPGSADRLATAVRDHWFEATDAGTHWVITDAPGDDHALPLAAAAADEAAWLAELNAHQANLTALTRELMGVQADLFTLWWKARAAAVVAGDPFDPTYPWNTSEAQFDAGIVALVSRAQRLAAQQSDAAALVPHETASTTLEEAIAVYAAAHGIAPGRELKPLAGPRFWSPADPVVVISGTGHTLPLDPNAIVPCRWTADLVAALEVDVGTGQPVAITRADAAAAIPSPPWANLPSATADLLAELTLLDPSLARQLSAAAGHALDPASVGAAQASIASVDVPAGSGVPPAIVSSFPWAPPWRPVFLDWKVRWYPVPFETPSGDGNWAFDGIDYTLDRPQDLPSDAPDFSGRTVLTPTPAVSVKARIDRYVADAPASPVATALLDVEGRIESVDRWDFLSQRLSGLGLQIAGWDSVPVEHPSAVPSGTHPPIGPLVGDQGGRRPITGTPDPPAGGKLPPSTYDAMRSGQFQIERLTIVDAFGQVREVVLEPDSTVNVPHTLDGQPFVPIVAEGLTSDHPILDGRVAELAPRVMQPGRLNVDLGGAGAGSPIVGWVLPSHLDRSLAAYDRRGDAIGALRLGAGPDGPVATWDPAPNSPWPASLPAPSDATGPLQAMFAELAQSGPAALLDALGAIDESLWSVDPAGAQTDAFLSVLVGRPLAMVVAELALDLQTDPWQTNLWPYTFTGAPTRFPEYRFEVRIGDANDPGDGLVGYFADGVYSRLHCAHLPEAGARADGYLQLIAPGAFEQLSFATSAGPGLALPVTMLVDPRAAVTMQCGLFPSKRFVLPAQDVDDAIARMTATVRTGPALVVQRPAAGAAGGPDAIVLPPLAQQRGTVSWIERTADGGWSEHPVAPTDDTAPLTSAAPTLREGLLQISGGIDE